MPAERFIFSFISRRSEREEKSLKASCPSDEGFNWKMRSLIILALNLFSAMSGVFSELSSDWLSDDLLIKLL